MIRNRRGVSSSGIITSSPTQVHEKADHLDAESEPIANSASVFASSTLSPTVSATVGKALGTILGVVIAWSFVLQAWADNMALGLGRWIVGGSSAGKEGVKMEPLGKEVKKIKRRRREVDPGSSGGEFLCPSPSSMGGETVGKLTSRLCGRRLLSRDDQSQWGVVLLELCLAGEY